MGRLIQLTGRLLRRSDSLWNPPQPVPEGQAQQYPEDAYDKQDEADGLEIDTGDRDSDRPTPDCAGGDEQDAERDSHDVSSQQCATAVATMLQEDGGKDLKAEGKADEAAGKVEEFLDDVKDEVDDVVDKVNDTLTTNRHH